MKLAILAAVLVAATVPAAQAAKTPLPGVVTPSGNIHCFYVPGPPGHLLCDIHQASYNKQEQAGCMARAGLDWHGWEVYATRKTVTTCSGGILYNSQHGHAEVHDARLRQDVEASRRSPARRASPASRAAHAGTGSSSPVRRGAAGDVQVERGERLRILDLGDVGEGKQEELEVLVLLR